MAVQTITAGIDEQVDFTDQDIFAAQGVPHEWLARLRAEDPVHWHPTTGGGGFWLITRHEDVVRVSRDWQIFSSDVAHGGIVGLSSRERQSREGNATERSLITMDPPAHGKYRRFVSHAMLPSAVAKVSDHVRVISRDLLDAALKKETFDFVDEIAAWIPLEALAELGNIPIGDREQMFQWINAVVAPDDPEFALTIEEAFAARASLQNYCIELYQSRALALGDDIISMMIKGEVDGKAVTAAQAGSFFELLLSAGSETTRTVMSHGAWALAQFPEQYQIMRRNPEIINTAVEEILRWATPVIYFRRGVTQDCELREKKIKAGDTVALCYSSANRDERVFDQPFVFNVTRKSNPHVSFGGRGPHNCMGANLARMELTIFFEELCSRVEKIELTGAPSHLRSNLTNGIKHLPLKFLPAS